MLILQRKVGQSLLIGEDISISVLEAREGRVRLAINAPRDITILRHELAEAAEVNRASVGEEISPLSLLGLLPGQNKEEK